MYLTKDEFLFLSGLKQGMQPYQVAQMYNLRYGTNDPRIVALFEKYGVKSFSDLIQKADLNKVVVCERDKIPYFKYDRYNLVRTIPICKEDVEQLSLFFKNISESNKEFELQTFDDGLAQSLDLVDVKTNKRYNIRWVIDGDVEYGSEHNWDLC